MKKEIAKKTGDLKVIPLGDRVLVKPILKNDKKNISGIIMPETIDKEKPETGKVVAVGEGKIEDGNLVNSCWLNNHERNFIYSIFRPG